MLNGTMARMFPAACRALCDILTKASKPSATTESLCCYLIAPSPRPAICQHTTVYRQRCCWGECVFVNKAHEWPSLCAVPSDKMTKKEPGWLQLLIITKALFLWYHCRLVINATQESSLERILGEDPAHGVVSLWLYNEHHTLCLLMETSGGRIMHISDPPLFFPLLSGLNVNICPQRAKDELEDCAEYLPFRWFIWSP